MITKSDWQAVHEELTAEDRRKLGEPPTTEEMLAYSRGELSAKDTERVRAWLVSNPEMARALTQPFPEDDARPGDPDYVSAEEIERRLAALKNRPHSAPAPEAEARVLQFRPIWTALAAALAVVFGVLFVRSEMELRRITSTPQATQNYTLESEQGRGVHEPPPLSVKTEFVTLLATPVDLDGAQYHVEITELSGTARHWEGPATLNEGVLSVLVPGKYLKPGRYSVVVYSGTEKDRLDSYKLRITP